MEDPKIQQLIVIGLAVALALCLGAYIVLPCVGFQIPASLGTIATTIVAGFLGALNLGKKTS